MILISSLSYGQMKNDCQVFKAKNLTFTEMKADISKKKTHSNIKMVSVVGLMTINTIESISYYSSSSTVREQTKIAHWGLIGVSAVLCVAIIITF